MDYSQYINPYDFNHPISDPNLFAGRASEMNDIKYYLTEGIRSSKAVNIAILGARSCGKTSLLNMIEKEAINSNYCVVRIELNESDSKNDASFFYKFYFDLVTKVCEEGAFGGKESQTYNNFLDMLFTYQIPTDNSFSPLFFPTVYAKSMDKNIDNFSITENMISMDLNKIRQTINKNIVILFDECNVLQNNRALLQKIRNVFQRIEGYMLILTGTPDLFPVMDDVFSPINRLFYRINLVSFLKEEETKACIENPLKKIGIKSEEIFDSRSFHEINEIHQLSTGRPYEIQLICHFMFKRVQLKKTDKMKIDLNVLEDVKKELETSQNITTRPIIRKVKNLTEKELSALNFLTTIDVITFDDLWQVEYILHGTKIWTKDILEQNLSKLVENEIVYLEDGIIKFKGDDFDKIYIKFYAREERKVFVNFSAFPIDLFFFLRLSPIFLKNFEVLTDLVSEKSKLNYYNIIEYFIDPEENDVVKNYSSNDINKTFKFLMQLKKNTNVYLSHLYIQLSNYNFEFWYYSQDLENKDNLIQKMLEEVNKINDRVREMKGTLVQEEYNFIPPNEDQLMTKIKNSGSKSLQKVIVESYHDSLRESYINGKEISTATEFADKIMSLNLDFNLYDDEILNDIGYIYLINKDYGKAENCFLLSIKNSVKTYKSLSAYNLGVAYLAQHKFIEFDELSILLENYINSNFDTFNLACLVVPKIDGKEITYNEEQNPVFFDSVRKLISIRHNLKQLNQ